MSGQIEAVVTHYSWGCYRVTFSEVAGGMNYHYRYGWEALVILQVRLELWLLRRQAAASARRSEYRRTIR